MPEVRLRGLEENDVELLLAERDEGAVPGGEASRGKALRSAVERGDRLEHGRLDLAVEAGGDAVVHIEARQIEGAMPPGVFEIGITMLVAARGQGLGGEAVRLLTELLLREHGTYRVQASTEVGNAPMRAVLERVGYTYEGVLRGFMPMENGGRADYAMYAVTRPDWA